MLSLFAFSTKFYVLTHLNSKSRPYWNYINIRIYEIPEKLMRKEFFTLT